MKESWPQKEGKGRFKKVLRKVTYGALAVGSVAGGAAAVKHHIGNLDEQKRIITEVETVSGIRNITPGSLDETETAFLKSYNETLRQISRLEPSERLSNLESLANEFLNHYGEIIQGLEDNNKVNELVKRYRNEDWLNMQNAISEMVAYAIAHAPPGVDLYQTSPSFQRLVNFSKAIDSKNVKQLSEMVRHDAIDSALTARGK